MKKIGLSYLIVSLSLGVFAPPAAGQDRLFKQVELPDQAKVISDDRTASLHAYFGRRNRLVQIDIGVLTSDRPFKLELFDDAIVIVRKVSIEEFIPGSWRWKGEVIAPRSPIYLQDGSPLTPEEQKELEDSAHRIELIIVENEHEKMTEEIDSPRPDTSMPTQAFGSNFGAEEEQVSRMIDPGKQYSIEGHIGVVALSNLYRIVPLQSAGDFHVVIEIDQDKMFFVPETGVTAEENKTNRGRRERYEEFKRQREGNREVSK